MEKRRISWIDWVKVFLIYLMVVGHALPLEKINQIIYAFHMPAFFFISGFLYHEHSWRKCLKAYGIPVIAFSFLNLVIWCIPKCINHTLDLTCFWERIYVPFVGGNTKNIDYIILFPGCWFVLALIINRFLMGDISLFSRIRKYSSLIIVGIILYLMIENVFFPDNPLIKYKFYRFLPALPFMLFGYSMRENLVKFKNKITFLLLFCFMILALYNGPCNMLGYEFGKSYLLYFVTAILGTLSIIGISSNLSSCKIIEILSKGTLFIMAFNFFIINTLRFVLQKVGLNIVCFDHILYPWIVGGVALFLSYYPIKWILKYCPILLGK